MQTADFVYKTHPFAHQELVFHRSRDERDFALLMEQGTGKSKVVIDTAAWLYLTGKIRLLVVVAPNGVHRNWVERELPVHMPDWCDVRAITWTSDLEKTKRGQRELNAVCWDTEHTGLRVVAMNVEAFSASPKTCRARALLERLLNAMPAMLAVDEATAIKTPGAQCTKNLTYCGKRAAYRRILTGTPVTQGPLDIYAPFTFLGEQYLGFSNHFAFKHHYAEWERDHNWRTGRDFERLIGYKNLDELVEKIDRVSYRVTKRECLDLPPKIYQSRAVEMSANQATWYEQLRKKLVLELGDDGETITMKNMLTRMLRLQQVIGGFVTTDNGEVVSLFERHRDNSRIQALLDVVAETSGKVIVWARFKEEIKAVVASLRAVYSNGVDPVVEYWGEVSEEDRNKAVDRFQNDNTCRFFVGNQAAGGRGLTLTQCDTMIYYSNSFSLEHRLQSEDRAHRAGLTHPVTYVDFECLGTIDSHILDALLRKNDIATQITRDKLRVWLAHAA